MTDWVLSGLVSKYHVFGVFLLDLYQQIPVLSVSVFSFKSRVSSICFVVVLKFTFPSNMPTHNKKAA